jgi:hypothetical protein
MPYILPSRRDDLDKFDDTPQEPGELNYMLTKRMIEMESLEHSYGMISDMALQLETVLYEFLRVNLPKQGMRYGLINAIVGAATAAELEYQRRRGNRYQAPMQLAVASFYTKVAAPYEDQKIQENGDVYA